MKDENTVINFARDEESDVESQDDNEARNDAVSDGQLEHTEEVEPALAVGAAPKPVPPRAKWVMGGFALVVGGMLLWTIGNFFGDDELQPWQLADSELQGTISNQYEALKGELTTAVEASTNATETRVMVALEQAQSGQNDATVSLAERLGSLEQGFTALKDQMAKQDTQIAEIRAMVEKQPTDIALIRKEVGLAVQKYDRKWSDLSADVVGGPIAAPVKTLQPTQLPFQIVSMDLWDGKPQLAVRENDNWRFLRVGDQLRGWTVSSADYGAGTVGLRDGKDRLFSTVLSTSGGPIAQAANGQQTASATGQPKLTVLTEPGEASVKVMNIIPKYHDGMALQPGAYDILVQRAGYQPHRRWIRVTNNDRVLHVALIRE